MGNPAFGFRDYNEMFVKRAASGGCGSEERAREAARAKEITGINSQNDVNQMIDWCRQEEEKKAMDAAKLSDMPAGPSGPANTPGGSLSNSEGILGSRGLTPAEFDFVTGQEDAKLDKAALTTHPIEGAAQMSRDRAVATELRKGAVAMPLE